MYYLNTFVLVFGEETLSVIANINISIPIYKNILRNSVICSKV